MTAKPDETVDEAEGQLHEAEGQLRQVQNLLGQPLAVYQASTDRQWHKIILAYTFMILGLGGIVAWFGFGPAKINHAVLHFLLLPTVIGFGLRWHLWNHRKLSVFVYPHGILRLQGRETLSFPWDEIDSIRLRLNSYSGPLLMAEDNQQVAGLWLEANPGGVQPWNTWLEVRRQDGQTARFTAALADFSDFARTVQLETFLPLKLQALAHLNAGRPAIFSDIRLNRETIAMGRTTVPWPEVGSIRFKGRYLHVKRRGAWVSAFAKDASAIPNLHVLLALAVEFGGRALLGESDSQDDEAASD